MASAVDDIAFAIARTSAKSGDEVAQAAAGSVARVVNKFDPSSLLRGMTSGSYFKNLKLPDVRFEQRCCSVVEPARYHATTMFCAMSTMTSSTF